MTKSILLSKLVYCGELGSTVYAHVDESFNKVKLVGVEIEFTLDEFKITYKVELLNKTKVTRHVFSDKSELRNYLLTGLPPMFHDRLPDDIVQSLSELPLESTAYVRNVRDIANPIKSTKVVGYKIYLYDGNQNTVMVSTTEGAYYLDSISNNKEDLVDKIINSMD